MLCVYNLQDSSEWEAEAWLAFLTESTGTLYIVVDGLTLWDIFAGVPIPSQLAAEGQEIETAIQQSLKESEEKGLTGAETTPFLLQRIQELTKGKSLAANIGLIKHNAAVGAQIAFALSRDGNEQQWP